MRKTVINIKSFNIPIYSLNTVILGSGTAGLNAALHLFMNGQKDIAIVTRDILGGTSRNAGSDKQTYYRLTSVGKTKDSPFDMAQALFCGGAMEGDIALIEATVSSQEFFHLVSIGVTFPHDQFGSYIGYKTDHDPRQRGTSTGPMMSYQMHECLLKEVKSKNIKILNNLEAVSIFKNEDKVIGILCFNKNQLGKENLGLVIFNCTNLVFATGGHGDLYEASAYPKSQKGSLGLAFEIGAKGRNLTEWQYGLASTKFRWGVSGAFQQVIPTYISTDKAEKDKREFLNDFFPSSGILATCIFLKGYQWPFDVRKIENYGSSLIDVLVHNEIYELKRKVYLDYTRNLKNFNFKELKKEAYNYLKKSGILFGTPIERLKKINPLAINVYLNHGIDISEELLEIAICAQHNNGGLSGNMWWESNIKHLFPIGEANGTHGVYRPGGSALNAGQVGGYRAAQYITLRYPNKALPVNKFFKIIKPMLENKIDLMLKLLNKIYLDSTFIEDTINRIERSMTQFGAHVRNLKGIKKVLKEAYNILNDVYEEITISSQNELATAIRLKETVWVHILYLEAMKKYILKGGASRGSFIILDKSGYNPYNKLKWFRYKHPDNFLNDKICYIWLDEKKKVKTEWSEVHKIPSSEAWFETTWQEYQKDKIIK